MPKEGNLNPAAQRGAGVDLPKNTARLQRLRIRQDQHLVGNRVSEAHARRSSLAILEVILDVLGRLWTGNWWGGDYRIRSARS